MHRTLFNSSSILCITFASFYDLPRAGLSIVPVVPWEGAPAARGPPADQLPNFYHVVLTFERNDD